MCMYWDFVLEKLFLEGIELRWNAIKCCEDLSKLLFWRGVYFWTLVWFYPHHRWIRFTFRPPRDRLLRMSHCRNGPQPRISTVSAWHGMAWHGSSHIREPLSYENKNCFWKARYVLHHSFQMDSSS